MPSLLLLLRTFVAFINKIIVIVSALTLLIGWQEGHPVCKNEWLDAGVVFCLGQGADLHMAHLMLLPFTVSRSSKSRFVLPSWYQLTRVVPDKGPLNVVVAYLVHLLKSLLWLLVIKHLLFELPCLPLPWGGEAEQLPLVMPLTSLAITRVTEIFTNLIRNLRGSVHPPDHLRLLWFCCLSCEKYVVCFCPF